MPRIRTIKPEFPQSESMGNVSRDARLLFILLWTLADDSGRLRGNSRMLASLLFPYDDDAPELISDWLEELEVENCIVRYRADDGGSYVAISNWLDHQKIDKASESKLPSPDSATIRESSRIFANPREPSIPSRARADQGPRTKEGTKDQGEEGTKEGCNEVASRPSLPPAAVDLESLSYPNFPCVRGKSSQRNVFTVEGSLVERMRDAFPSIDVAGEFKKAHVWIMANRSRRKTFSGMEEFLLRWVMRANDSRRPAQSTFAQQRVENTKRAIEEFVNDA